MPTAKATRKPRTNPQHIAQLAQARLDGHLICTDEYGQGTVQKHWQALCFREGQPCIKVVHYAGFPPFVDLSLDIRSEFLPTPTIKAMRALLSEVGQAPHAFAVGAGAFVPETYLPLVIRQLRILAESRLAVQA